VCLSKISKSLSGYGLSFLIIFHALYVFLVLAHVAFYRLQSKLYACTVLHTCGRKTPSTRNHPCNNVLHNLTVSC